jgi:hypothetical protein
MTRPNPPRKPSARIPAVRDIEDLADSLYAFIESITGIVTVAFLGFVAVLIAIGLTGPAIQFIGNIPTFLKGAGRIAKVAWSLPWAHWIVFPIVLALVVTAMWYWIQREQRNDERPSRGRTILSGDELRRSASRLNRPESRPPKSRRPS